MSDSRTPRPPVPENGGGDQEGKEQNFSFSSAPSFDGSEETTAVNGNWDDFDFPSELSKNHGDETELPEAFALPEDFFEQKGAAEEYAEEFCGDDAGELLEDESEDELFEDEPEEDPAGEEPAEAFFDEEVPEAFLEEASPAEENAPETADTPAEPGESPTPERKAESGYTQAEFDKRAWALMGSEKQPPKEPQPPVEEALLPPKEPEKEEKLPRWIFGEEEREYRPVRFRRDGRSGCLGGMMYAAFVICLSIVLACVAWMAASDVLALNKEPLTAEVTLSEDIFTESTESVEKEDGTTEEKKVRRADIDAVTKALKDAGFINYRWLFKLYASFSHAELHLDPGTYELSTSYDYRALVKKMQIGSDSQVQTKVTFPEGFTMAQIFARLEENRICSVEDLYKAAAETEFSYAFLEGVPTGDAGRLEGFLFPDTYYFYEGMQASSAINKFLSDFHYRITAEMIQRLYDRGMSYKDAVTVASIIEREAANDDERYLIASVIYNRLNRGMPLQMDATVLYGEGNPEGVAMPTGTMLANTENPYNTYVYQGLPPGPISNPGMASIRAALYPGDTQYLFYALDETTGTHRFFLFQAEFEAFLATQSYHQ